MQAVLPGCLRRGTRIVTNQGWLNPDGAAKRIAYWLAQHGAKGKKVAAVSGGIITDRVLQLTDRILENGKPTNESRRLDGLRGGLPRRRAHRAGACERAPTSSSPAAWPIRRSSSRR
jgi:hypothetical protein